MTRGTEFTAMEPGELDEWVARGSKDDVTFMRDQQMQVCRFQCQLYDASEDVEHLWRAWRAARATSAVSPACLKLLAPRLDRLARRPRAATRADQRDRRIRKLLMYYSIVSRGKTKAEAMRMTAEIFGAPSADAIKQIVLEYEKKTNRNR